MTNTDTCDAVATLAQIRELAAAGCDLIRVAVPDEAAVKALRKIVANSPLPVIADIHFDYRLALAAIKAGAPGIRINPGNLGGPRRLAEVGRAAADHDTVVRVGVNGGSLEKSLLREFGGVTPEALTASALKACETLEKVGCHKLKVSLKSSTVRDTVAACRHFSSVADYPLHLGLTEAGPPSTGLIKSAVTIGCLLLEGIGSTLRVSLTAPPLEEVKAGLRILQAVGLRCSAPEIISCPTCGRTQVDLFRLVAAVEKEINCLQAKGNTIHLRKIAVMGCAVNGPGEAREADVGIAGGRGMGVLFKAGKIIRSLPESELWPALRREIRLASQPGKPR